MASRLSRLAPARVQAVRHAFRRGGILLLAASVLRYLSDRTMAFAAVRTLARRSATDGSIDEALDTAYAFEGWNVVAPNQIRSEIAALLELLAVEPPRTVLEIGTARGGTLFLLSRVAADDATLITVDLPYSGACGNAGYPPAIASVFRSFARDGQRIELVQGDSHEDETRAIVERILDGRPLDFLLVDGDHTEAGARRDFEMYSRLVRRGGYVVLHDIVPGRPELSGGVPELWRELKVPRDHQELVKDWEQGAFGIGVIKKGTDYGAVG